MNQIKLERSVKHSDLINDWLDAHLPSSIEIWRQRINFDRAEEVVLIDPIGGAEHRFTIESVRQSAPRLPPGCGRGIQDFLHKLVSHRNVVINFVSDTGSAAKNHFDIDGEADFRG